MRIAAPKDRSYLESLNLKQLQKDRKPAEDQDKREFYQELQQQAKEGPLFQEDTLSLVEELPELPKHVTKWLANLAKAGSLDIDPRGLNLIVDWANGDPESRKIQNMTWDQAMEAQKAWHESTFEVHDTGDYKTKDVVQDLGGGWTMVRINNEHDLDVEGDLMGHCVGGDDYWDAVQNGHQYIYSLRDPQNKPHVTIDVDADTNRVWQCYGKQNTKPIKKYNPYLIKFFSAHDMLDGLLHLDDMADIPEHLWSELIDRATPKQLAHIAFTKNLPPKVQQILAERYKNNAHLMDLMMSNRGVTEDVLLYILQNSSHANAERILDNPNAGDAVIQALLAENDPEINAILADSPKATPDVLRAILPVASKDARITMAKNPNTTADILAQLATDHMSTVRDWVSRHNNISPRTLDDMADDRDYIVRSNVAQHHKTTADTLTKLAHDPEGDVRYWVAKNRNTPIDALEILATDSNRYVSAEASAALARKRL